LVPQFFAPLHISGLATPLQASLICLGNSWVYPSRAGRAGSAIHSKLHLL